MSDRSDSKAAFGHTRMRPRARLISLIGGELISDEPVAVVELVKNAYDADASRVDVRFTGDDPSDPDSLVIEDDGIGMSLQTVLEGWLEPGSVLKKRNDTSPGGRPYQGAKGIARLAESLLMETREAGSARGLSVLLDWGLFDDESYLDDVTIDYQEETSLDFEHGTRLRLINLHARRHWTEEDFQALHNRLSRLVSPFADAKDEQHLQDFEIHMDVPSLPELRGPVQPHEITKRPKYQLDGTLSKDAKFRGCLEIDGEKSAYFESRRLGGRDETVECGPFGVTIRAWDRDRPGLAPYMVKYDLGITKIRQLLDEYCGVSVYRDGFRVYPYGEKGNDWLSLDTRSRQTPTLRLANNQIIASIRIFRSTNPELIDRSTREGMVHNHAYQSLMKWFTRILALLEEERYRVRPRQDAPSTEPAALFETFDMSALVEQVSQQLGKTHPVADLVRRKDADIREGVARLQEHYSRVLRAAGLGQLVDVVIHEIGAPLGKVNRELAYLSRQTAKVAPDTHRQTLEPTFEDIRAWLAQIAALRERLMPRAGGRRGRATVFGVQDEIASNIDLYEGLLARQRLVPEVRAPRKPLVVQMARSSLGQIIANLLDNSLYWVTQQYGQGNGGHILIELKPLEHGFRIRVADDGPGVPDEDRERIFEFEFSRKPNGMGLGLFIAREVIEPYGRLVYSDAGPLSGACFDAIFEQRVGL